MPAPTALRKPDDLVEEAMEDAPQEEQDGGVLLDPTTPAPTTTTDTLMATDASEPQITPDGRPHFAPAQEVRTIFHVETRKVLIPPHRFAPLKNNWSKIYSPLVEHLKLQVRMNVKSRAVEMRTSKATTDPGALQKGEDFVKAFSLGFDVDDAIALLRLDDLYIETFEVKDVKTLTGDHLSRAIGRIAGKDGKTKFAIENASKTRVVLADSKIHILGGFQNIHVARESIVSLILGAPPGKVYNSLRTVSARMKERF
ncbi:pre-rRNA-processing protein PNO1 [Trichodelitschia bisporula]|uniref:Pre-rRNA-processing protein PNO1 n=1 Tax=Trichodelitschia bisporula TaxID=703511 RepID=A0A6G1IBH2_9PEZI|nr:pre-rRNA-processing protein PNO1 [Trichodelitschia bisporula]